MANASLVTQLVQWEIIHTKVIGLSYLGPGWGVGASDCVEEVGGGGGVVGGGEVSIGWEEGDGVEVVDEDEGGAAAEAGLESNWEEESPDWPWKRHTEPWSFVPNKAGFR